MAQPMYRLIAEDLHLRIESGELRPNEMLPSEGDLCEKYHASRNTVRDALKLLTTRGLVEKRNGLGTFVSRRIDSFVTTLSCHEQKVHYLSNTGGILQNVTTSGISLKIQKASGALAAMLGLPEGAELISRQLARYVDGIPWYLQEVYYPRELVARETEPLLLEDDIPVDNAPEAVTNEDICGLNLQGWHDWISFTRPSRSEAEHFGLPDDGSVSMAIVHRIHYALGKDGLFPYRITVTAYPADRNQFLVASGDVPDSARLGKGRN